MMRTVLKLIILLAALSLAACSAYDPYGYTKAGAASGAAAGGLLGYQINEGAGAAVGAATGAVVGGSVGYMMDQKRNRESASYYDDPYRHKRYPPRRRHGYAPPPPGYGW